MRCIALYLAFVAAIVSAPFAADRIVDWRFQAGFTQTEADAHAELVVRAGKEADARKKKPSLSEQAMIVRDLYGY